MFDNLDFLYLIRLIDYFITLVLAFYMATGIAEFVGSTGQLGYGDLAFEEEFTYIRVHGQVLQVEAHPVDETFAAGLKRLNHLLFIGHISIRSSFVSRKRL
jgi:hypothetical protein